MSIDEFMRDIAPKMRPGWVAMDGDKIWFLYSEEPVKYWFEGYWGACITTPVIRLNDIFDIIPVDDWETSLRKVGGNE